VVNRQTKEATDIMKRNPHIGSDAAAFATPKGSQHRNWCKRKIRRILRKL
jgi:hypothetical protein